MLKNIIEIRPQNCMDSNKVLTKVWEPTTMELFCLILKEIAIKMYCRMIFDYNV